MQIFPSSNKAGDYSIDSLTCSFERSCTNKTGSLGNGASPEINQASNSLIPQQELWRSSTQARLSQTNRQKSRWYQLQRHWTEHPGEDDTSLQIDGNSHSPSNLAFSCCSGGRGPRSGGRTSLNCGVGPSPVAMPEERLLMTCVASSCCLGFG